MGFASQVWSNLAAPMQSVAEYAFSEPDELVRHRTAATHLHGLVARAVHDIFVALRHLGHVAPDGAFYVYPDFEPHRMRLAQNGIRSGTDLEQWLLDEHAVAVLAGSAFGDHRDALRFRAATSLLYGATPELRWQALDARDPLAVPHVAAVLDRLESVVARVTSG